VAERPEFCSASYLLEKRSKNSFRHIVNLRPLNKFLACPKLKYESLLQLKYLMGKFTHSISFDLESGYYLVGIHPDHQQFLGFEALGRFYCYTALPFGLSVSPYIFTKVVKVFAAFMRRPVFANGSLFSANGVSKQVTR
jgi:hypothetical protein